MIIYQEMKASKGTKTLIFVCYAIFFQVPVKYIYSGFCLWVNLCERSSERERERPTLILKSEANILKSLGKSFLLMFYCGNASNTSTDECEWCSVDHLISKHSSAVGALWPKVKRCGPLHSPANPAITAAHNRPNPHSQMGQLKAFPLCVLCQVSKLE